MWEFGLNAQCSCLGRLDGLRLKLEKQGLKNISYMVVNDKAENAQRLHHKLAEKLSEHIPLYAQSRSEPQDIWQILNGEKDDFLIYDRFDSLWFQ